MADKTLLKDHVTDPKQQVHCTILSAKVIDDDLFDVKVAFSDKSEAEGEMLSPGGRVPKKDEKFKLTLEVRDDKDVVCGYPM